MPVRLPKALAIGSVHIDPPLVLAPMAGYTDAAFRALCRSFGAGLSYTEVLNAPAIVHGSRKTLAMMERDASDRPCVAHLYDADPDMIAGAAARATREVGYELVDINCGCPVRRIVARGAGAALIREPGRIAAIVRATVEAVDVPVMVKTRIGFEVGEDCVSEIAQAAEECGASAVAIHGRYARMHHRGPSDWEMLARVKAERGIPVIGNGGIDRAEDAVRMLAETGVDAAMIGRAAIGNPWVFARGLSLLKGEDSGLHSLDEHRAVILRHLASAVAFRERALAVHRVRTRYSAEHAAVLHFRGHLFQYLCGFPDWADVRRGLNGLKCVADVMEAVDRVISRARARGWSPGHTGSDGPASG